MIDFLDKKDLGEIMKIAKQEPDIKKAVKEMLELPVGRVSCCDTIETLIALKGLPDVEKIELFRLTVNRASELEKEMQDQFDWGITK